VRDAGAAKAALNGRTMFGVKLRLFSGPLVMTMMTMTTAEQLLRRRRERWRRVRWRRVREGRYYYYYYHSHRQLCIPIPSPPTPTATSCIPFPVPHQSSPTPTPTPSPAAEDNHETSEPFFVFDKNGKVRPRSVSAGNDGLPPIRHHTVLDLDLDLLCRSTLRRFLFYFPSGGNSTLYSSSPPTSPSGYGAAADTHGRRSSNHLFFDAVGKPSTHEDRDSGDRERPRSLNVDIPVNVVSAFDELDIGSDGVTPTSYAGVHYSHPHPHLHSQHHHPNNNKNTNNYSRRRIFTPRLIHMTPPPFIPRIIIRLLHLPSLLMPIPR